MPASEDLLPEKKKRRQGHAKGAGERPKAGSHAPRESRVKIPQCTPIKELEVLAFLLEK